MQTIENNEKANIREVPLRDTSEFNFNQGKFITRERSESASGSLLTDVGMPYNGEVFGFDGQVYHPACTF